MIGSNLRIGARLGLAFGVVLLITALMALTGMWRLGSLKDEAQKRAVLARLAQPGAQRPPARGGDGVDAFVGPRVLSDVLLADQRELGQAAQLRVDLRVRGMPEVRGAGLETRLDLVARAGPAGQLAEHRVGRHRKRPQFSNSLTNYDVLGYYYLAYSFRA